MNMCGSQWVYVAVCCSVLQCVAVDVREQLLMTRFPCNHEPVHCRCLPVAHLLQRVAVTCVCCRVLQSMGMCCSVLQCVAVCCSVLQCVAVCCSVPQCAAVCCSVLLQCAAVCCSVLQCAAVCCSVLQCVAVDIREQLLMTW